MNQILSPPHPCAVGDDSPGRAGHVRHTREGRTAPSTPLAQSARTAWVPGVQSQSGQPSLPLDTVPG